MAIVFQIRPLDTPLDVREISPQTIAGKSLDEIRSLPVNQGNPSVTCGDCFELLHSEKDNFDLIWRGETHRLEGLCEQMSAGRVLIDGNAANRVATSMCGGELEIRGSAGDRLGCEMSGGTIRVLGNVGNQLGSALPGSRRGMCGGEILVHGNAGNEVGCRMRRGWILIEGSTGDFTGYQMLAGTILVFGSCGRFAGAEMVRGTLGLLGDLDPNSILPEFEHGNLLDSVIVRMMGIKAEQRGFNAAALMKGPLQMLHGDAAGGRRGELLVRTR